MNKEMDLQPGFCESIDDQQDARSTQEASDGSLSNQLPNLLSDSKQVEYTDTHDSSVFSAVNDFGAQKDNNEILNIDKNLKTLNYEETWNPSDVEEFFWASSLSIRNASKIIYCLYKLSNKSEVKTDEFGYI